MVNYSVFPLTFPFVFTEAYGKPVPRNVRTGLGKADYKVNIGNRHKKSIILDSLNIKGDI